MTQTRLGSLIESFVNILIGFGVGVGSQMLIFPLFNIHVTTVENFAIGAWFTVVSLVRSYAIRRWFNARLRSGSAALARTVSL